MDPESASARDGCHRHPWPAAQEKLGILNQPRNRSLISAFCLLCTHLVIVPFEDRQAEGTGVGKRCQNPGLRTNQSKSPRSTLQLQQFPRSWKRRRRKMRKLRMLLLRSPMPLLGLPNPYLFRLISLQRHSRRAMAHRSFPRFSLSR